MSENNIEIIEELRQIKKLLMVIATKNEEQKDQVRILSNAGFQPKEIAELIGTTANTVRVTLNRIKSETK